MTTQASERRSSEFAMENFRGVPPQAEIRDLFPAPRQQFAGLPNLVPQETPVSTNTPYSHNDSEAPSRTPFSSSARQFFFQYAVVDMIPAIHHKRSGPSGAGKPFSCNFSETALYSRFQADIAHFKPPDITDNQRLFRANPAAHIVQDNPSQRHGAPATKADRPPRIQKNIRKHDVVKQPCLHSFIHGNFNGKPAYRDGDSREGKVADFRLRNVFSVNSPNLCRQPFR